MKTKISRFPALSFVAVLMAGIGARAATITWTNTTGGNWSAAANWSPHQVPTNTDNVFLTTPGTYAVVVDSYGANVFVNIANLTLGAGGGASGVQTLYVTNTLIGFNVLNSMLVTSGGVFTAGADYTSVGAATMTVANGGVLVANAFHAGFFLGGMVVTNGGVVYANNYPFVGAGSTPSATFSGPVKVENGGLLVANNVNVGGFGGSWFSIGPGGVLTGSGGFATLTNAGMINLTNTSIHGDLLNQPGGVVNLAGGATLSGNSFGGNYFTNLGTVLASGASPNTINSAHFETRQGTVTNLSGVLSMGTLMNLTGTYFADAGATNQFVAINDGANYATAGTPLVLAGPGQFQFTSGDLSLPANVIPNLALLGGQLRLGAGFQGGAITNLKLEGITLLGNSLPITGDLSATKNSEIEGDSVVASGGRFTAANFHSLGSIRVNNGGNFTASAFTNGAPLLVAAGGVANLSADISVYAPCTNSGSINLSNATVSVINNLTYLLGGIFNQAGGAMNFLGDGSSVSYNNGPEYFINRGSLVFNSPLGTNSINFLNLDLSQGTLSNLAGTGVLRVFQTNLVGTYYAAAGAIIQFKNSNVDFVNGYDFNTVTNFATPGTPFVLNGGGQFQFAGGNLYLPTNVPPRLSLVGGILKLGPNFQGGAITNLTFAGFLLTNALSTALPITGTLTVSNCGGSRFISYNQPLPTGVWGNFTVGSGGVLHSYNSSFNNNLTVAAGGLVSLVPGSLSVGSSGTLSVANGGTINIAAGGLTLFGPLNNAGIINISNPPPAFISGIMSANDGSALYRGGILNQAPGIINLADDNAYLTTYSFGKEYLVNQGQIVKTGGTNLSAAVAPFTTNSGAITAQRGTIGMQPFTTLPGGSLNVTLNSDTDYGRILTVTNVVLGGAFNVTLKSGYHPAKGATFNVLSYLSHTGSFSRLGLPSGLTWQSLYGATNFSLLVGSSQPYIGTFQLLGTNAILGGTGGSPGSNYVVMATTNLTLPLVNWTALTTNAFDGGGQFHFTNPVSPTKPRQFFIFKLP